VKPFSTEFEYLERKQFEERYWKCVQDAPIRPERKELFDRHRDLSSGRYTRPEVQAAWWGWLERACKAALTPEVDQKEEIRWTE
jgi:hypothetical protein